jgi:nicotinate-nucleotide adenylyltransferase
VAEALVDKFHFDRLLFVPANVPPHKRDQDISASYHRYAMISLATADAPRLLVSAIELEAPARPYTIETLGRLQEVYPDAGLFFIMGADSFAEVTLWREHARLLRQYGVVVATRPGFAGDSDLIAHLSPDLQARVIDLRGGKSPNEVNLATPRIFLTDFVSEDVSATQIRERIARGERIDELVPPAVADYIAKYDIYQWRA